MKRLLAFLALIPLVLPLQAHSAQFLGGEESVYFQKTVNENVYAAADTVTIDGTVNGDVYAAGATVVMNGKVSKDVVAAGGTVIINGIITEDVRAAGGTVNIKGTVRGETLLAGRTVSIDSTASTTGQLTAVAQNFILDGYTGGNADIRGQKVTIRGRINGSVNIEADQLNIESTANIVGPLTYKSPNKATIQSGAKLGAVTYNQAPAKKTKTPFLPASIGFARIVRWLMSLVLALAIYGIFRGPTTRVIERAGSNVGKTMLTGFIWIITVPIIMILILLTLIGFPLSILIALVYTLILIIGGAFGSMFLGSLLWKSIKKLPYYPLNWVVVLIGVTVSTLLHFIPFIGWLIRFGLFLIGVGGIVLSVWEARRPEPVLEAQK